MSSELEFKKDSYLDFSVQLRLRLKIGAIEKKSIHF